MQLENKRIIVTGCASGIGAGTIRAFAREGAIICALDRDAAGGEAAVSEANTGSGGSVHFYHCDIAERDQVFDVFRDAEAAMGGLDVLVNVAGIENSGAAEDFTDEDLSHMWSVNINGTVHTNQAACKLMQKQGAGAIINFSSDAALAGMPNSAAYAASKGAVLAWTKTIAYEWGVKFNIRCNTVCPAIRTPMYEAWLAGLTEEDRQAHLAAEKLRVPIGGSMGDVDKDMAPVMVFLASDASKFIDGQIFCVNGGRNMVRG
ncbi:MAG: SDR family NAD(P)-dependent oxidoreductase [Halieaceae bacterium]|nr:SDR family NAD(P)-dependent oxidoreductase [Halieaceae bacterium]